MIHRLWPIAVLLLAACAGTAPPLRTGSQAVDRCAATYLEAGNLHDARDCFEKVLLAPGSQARASFLLADLLDSTGHPQSAVIHYFRAVEAALETTGFAAEATSAAMGIVGIRDRVEGLGELFADFMTRIAPRFDALPPEARYQLLSLQIGLARRHGRTAQARQGVERAGCLTRWRVAGPFGPELWHLFENRDLPDENAPFPRSVSRLSRSSLNSRPTPIPDRRIRRVS